MREGRTIKKMEYEIKQKKFRNKETGEIVTQFNILEISKYEEIKENEE